MNMCEGKGQCGRAGKNIEPNDGREVHTREIPELYPHRKGFFQSRSLWFETSLNYLSRTHTYIAFLAYLTSICIYSERETDTCDER